MESLRAQLSVHYEFDQAWKMPNTTPPEALSRHSLYRLNTSKIVAKKGNKIRLVVQANCVIQSKWKTRYIALGTNQR